MTKRRIFILSFILALLAWFSRAGLPLKELLNYSGNTGPMKILLDLGGIAMYWFAGYFILNAFFGKSDS